MENSSQPYSPNPLQEAYSLQSGSQQRQQAYPIQEIHPLQQYPQQPYPLHQTYPSTQLPQKKSNGLTIASFIVSGFAYFLEIATIISTHDAGDGRAAGIPFMFVLICLPLLIISTILATFGIALNRTKSAVIALIIAILPIAAFVLLILGMALKSVENF